MAIAAYVFIYAVVDKQKYFTTAYGYSVDHVFIHIFCLAGWTFLLLVFSIDFFDPIWKFYLLLANRSEVIPYPRSKEGDANMEK